MGVKPIQTSPYHTQTDGLVESYNQTLKMMLKKVMIKEPKSWDQLLPLVLFSYQEVPQEATGFSPFELILGRDVHPLDILKERWLPSQEKLSDIAAYVTQLRDRMQSVSEKFGRTYKRLKCNRNAGMIRRRESAI